MKAAFSINNKLYTSPILNIKNLMQDGNISKLISSDVLNDLVSKNILKIQNSSKGETFIFSDLINTFIREHHLLTITGKLQNE